MLSQLRQWVFRPIAIGSSNRRLIQLPAAGALRREDAEGAQLRAGNAIRAAIGLTLEHGLQFSEFSLFVLLCLTPALGCEQFNPEHETLHVVEHKLGRSKPFRGNRQKSFGIKPAAITLPGNGEPAPDEQHLRSAARDPTKISIPMK